MTKKTKHNLADLEQLYSDADQCDKELFAEMRSNLLLIAGEHYQKKNSSFYKRLRDAEGISEQTKLRLTKNHIQKIHKTYVNNIVSAAPGVGIEPKNQSEIQDQKSAELNHAVWRDAVDRQGMDDRVDDWGDNFCGIGEVACKVFWDPNAGKVKAYEQKVEDDGTPVWLDAEGNETQEQVMDPLSGESILQPAPGKPVYTGDFVIEDIYGFNLLRSPEAKDMKFSPYLIIRKMVDVADLQAKFPDHAKEIKESSDETVVVFDSVKGGYSKANNQVMLKEIYFRPCPQYPRGYFYFWTREVILAQGELPGGIFPIIFRPFEKIQTSPRGRSPIKTMRPYQIEINRAASKMAEHQITLGDDKILIQNGTKISAGVALPGVRSINYSGMEPGILAGRDGSQYLNYMQSQIAELYDVMNVAEESADSKEGQLDPYTLLFRSAREKKKFKRNVKKFEGFLVEVARTYLELAKIHMPEDAVVQAAGRNERVNIAEFKNTTDLCYQIKLTPQAEDIEGKLGKQLVLNHALQYVGNKLEREDIGKLLRAMPYSNVDESFNDLTIDYDAATNFVLALDRGEKPPINGYDNFVYMIKRLVARVRQADFLYLDPAIQENYRAAISRMEQLEVDRQQKILMAQKGYIPTGGYMVTVDLYVSDPTNPLKTRRARVPYQALEWLIKALETQGMSLDQLERMNQGALAEMADKLGGAPDGMGASPTNPGAAMPEGAPNVPELGRTAV